MKVVVVDDEPLARRRLKAMLAEQSDVEVVAEYEDPTDAMKALADSNADVLFLDIQMPELDGFQMLDGIGSRPPPFVIFVTAHAEHAVRAFDTDATDYLLKPYDRERLERSLDRARAALAATDPSNGGALGTQVRQLVDQLRERTVYLDRVAVTMGRRTYFVSTRAIDWVQADRNYLRLHVGTKCHLIRSTISGIESRLDPTQFARVHRSFIVRIDNVKELRALVSGEYRVVLVDGTELPMSPQYRDRLPRG
jgi:two-component system LytT family response regulator